MSKRDKVRLFRKIKRSVMQQKAQIHLSFAALALQRFRAFLVSILDKRVFLDADTSCPLFVLLGA